MRREKVIKMPRKTWIANDESIDRVTVHTNKTACLLCHDGVQWGLVQQERLLPDNVALLNSTETRVRKRERERERERGKERETNEIHETLSLLVFGLESASSFVTRNDPDVRKIIANPPLTV
jgi:hypothetical protein